MSGKKAAPSARELIQAQMKQKSATRLVNSPHAKYNSRNQLMCVVCGCRVTSAIVWHTHIAKKSHLDNLQNLKQKQYLLNNQVANKRKAPFTSVDAPPPKKVPTAAPFKPKGILKGIKSYESSSEDEDDTAVVANSNVSSTMVDGSPSTDSAVKAELKDEPMDTLDETLAPIKTEDENDPSGFYLTESEKKGPAPLPKPNTTEKLPEGFFDDPVADAKARKVEYVNKDEAEWNAFMREVSVAETTSRQIIADDTEESAKRNQILQAEEQMQLYQRVLQFDQAKQEAPVGEPSTQLSSDDDSDIDEMDTLNWRNKNSHI